VVGGFSMLRELFRQKEEGKEEKRKQVRAILYLALRHPELVSGSIQRPPVGRVMKPAIIFKHSMLEFRGAIDPETSSG
jgi:hypothetical protein